MTFICGLRARDRQEGRIAGGADTLEGPQRPALFREELRQDSILPMDGKQERLRMADMVAASEDSDAGARSSTGRQLAGHVADWRALAIWGKFSYSVRAGRSRVRLYM